MLPDIYSFTWLFEEKRKNQKEKKKEEQTGTTARIRTKKIMSLFFLHYNSYWIHSQILMANL